MNDAGIIVITAFISPFKDDRKMAREIIGEDKYIELSSEELEDLIRELKSTLEYHLYKLRKRSG